MPDATTHDPMLDPAPKPPTQRKRSLRWILGICAILLAISVVLLALGWTIVGKPIAAPDWLRDRLSARLDATLSGVDVHMGQITLVVGSDLTPAVAIEDVRLRHKATGTRLLELTRADAEFSRSALLRGQIQAKNVSAAGLLLRLRRERDGSFNLELGEGLSPSGADLATLLRQIDNTLENEQLTGLARVSLNAVTLDYQDALSGRAWLIDGGRVSGTRSSDAITIRGDFALLSGGSDVATLSVSARSPTDAPDIDIGMALQNLPAADIAAQSEALSWLGLLRASISGSMRTGFDASGALRPLNARLQIGEGFLQPTDETRPIPFQSAGAYFAYDPAALRFDFSQVSVASDWIDASGDGTATLGFDEDGTLDGLTAQLALTGLSANPFDVYESPRALDRASVDLHLGLKPFVIDVGQIALQSEGTRVLGRAQVRADSKGWSVMAEAHSPETSVPDVMAFWPASQVIGTRTWIDTNVRGGRLKDVQIAVLSTPEHPRPEVYLGAEIQDGQLRFLRDFPELSDIQGRLTLNDHQLSIVADRATATPAEGGSVRADGTVFVIKDVTQRPSQADLRLRTSSSITAALSLVNNPPLNVMERSNQPVDLAEGRAVLTGRLQFPIRRALTGRDVAYEVVGRLQDVRSSVLVPGRVLSSPALSLSVTPTEVKVGGTGDLDAVPFNGRWRLPLGAPAGERGSTIEADVELSPRTLAAFNIKLPPGTLSGKGLGKLKIDLRPGGASAFSLSSNLDGVGLAVPSLGWSMSPRTQGRFALSGALGAPIRVDRISLDAPGLSGAGRVRLADSGVFETLEIKRLRVGRWLDAPLTLTSRGQGTPVALALSGGTLDIRKAPQGTTSGGVGVGPTGPITLGLERLQLTDTLALTDLRGNFTAAGALAGDFTARINGGAPIQGRATATAQGTAYVIRAKDGGGVLRDGALFENLNDGQFTLRLKPTGQTGTFDGELTIRSARMRDAPAVAELLNAFSIVGLLTQLNGEGIYFDEIEARFRLSPGRVIVTQSSAVGPSMGISLDGYYDIANQEIDMQGVLSPIYAINILGRAIARKGEGLIGFNFNMTGPAKNPAVSVNPLSALTPGLFREIFRRPPPKVSE